MDRVRIFSDSRDLCDDLVDNGYQPNYGGWFENEDGIRVRFHDDNFQHIDVENGDMCEYEMPISEVFYNENSECYAANIKLF